MTVDNPLYKSYSSKLIKNDNLTKEMNISLSGRTLTKNNYNFDTDNEKIEVKCKGVLRKNIKMTFLKRSLIKIINSMLFITWIEKMVKESRESQRLFSIKKFAYYINTELIEEKICDWMYSLIKTPILSILKTDHICFDIKSKSANTKPTEETNEKYLKLEVRKYQ